MGEELNFFYAFTAVSQIVVGVILLVIGDSTATHIIGIIVIVLGLLTGVGPIRALLASPRDDQPRDDMPVDD